MQAAIPNTVPKRRTLKYTQHGWKFADETTAPNPPYSLSVVGKLGNRLYQPAEQQPPVQGPASRPLAIGDIAIFHTRTRDEITGNILPPETARIAAVRRGGRELDIGSKTYTYRPGANGYYPKGVTRNLYLYDTLTFRSPTGEEITWRPGETA